MHLHMSATLWTHKFVLGVRHESFHVIPAAPSQRPNKEKSSHAMYSRTRTSHTPPRAIANEYSPHHQDRAQSEDAQSDGVHVCRCHDVILCEVLRGCVIKLSLKCYSKACDTCVHVCFQRALCQFNQQSLELLLPIGAVSLHEKTDHVPQGYQPSLTTIEQCCYHDQRVLRSARFSASCLNLFRLVLI